jgi:lysine/ornithine N-monooxygenase
LEGRASALKAENATLQAKYGAETENVKKEAIAAMQKLGFTLEDASKLTSSLGLANAIDKFYELSKQTKSGAVPNPQTDGTIDYSGITAAEAAKRLEALDKDKVFAERLAKGDILAKNEIKRLIAIKNGVSVNAEGKYV